MCVDIYVPDAAASLAGRCEDARTASSIIKEKLSPEYAALAYSSAFGLMNVLTREIRNVTKPLLSTTRT